jgi:hypothetical protein
VGLFPDTVPGLSSVYEHEGMWWSDPSASANLVFWHLYLDAEQRYGGARTGGVTAPGYRGADPYWIGKWVAAGWAILVDNESAWSGPPYRLFLTPDPWYVALLCNAAADPPWYSIVDAPPELAKKASANLGYYNAGGYGLVEKSGGAVAFPSVPQLPGVPTLPAIPTLPGGYAPALDPIPADAVANEPRTAPERTTAPAPGWLIPAVGAFGGLAVLWYLRRTGRI